MQGIGQFDPGRLAELLEHGRRRLAGMDPARVFRMDAAGRCLGEGVCGVIAGRECLAGEVDHRFTLMSAVKPFLLLRLLELYGPGEVSEWVGGTPSALPYYSLEQLLTDGGKPRNAMINSGAMLLASKLPGQAPAEQERLFVQWLRGFAPAVRLALDRVCLAEAMQVGGDSANLALAEALEHSGRVDSAAAVYEIYFRICCLAGTLREVARLGFSLATTGSPWRNQVLRVMAGCGLYEGSAQWFENTGLPAKSGVSGVMFGVWPGQGCLAACSPWLDAGGNPIFPQVVLAEAAGNWRPCNFDSGACPETATGDPG